MAVSVFHISNNNSCKRDLKTRVSVLLTKWRKVEMIKLSPSENLLVVNRKLVSCVNTCSSHFFSGNHNRLCACSLYRR